MAGRVEHRAFAMDTGAFVEAFAAFVGTEKAIVVFAVTVALSVFGAFAGSCLFWYYP